MSLQKCIGAESKHITNLSITRPLRPEDFPKEKISFCIAKHHFHPVLLEMHRGRKGRRGMSWTDPISSQTASLCSISDSQDKAEGSGFLKVANVSKASLQSEILTLSSSRRDRAKSRENITEEEDPHTDTAAEKKEDCLMFFTPPYALQCNVEDCKAKPPPIRSPSQSQSSDSQLLPSRLQWCESTISCVGISHPRIELLNPEKLRGAGLPDEWEFSTVSGWRHNNCEWTIIEDEAERMRCSHCLNAYRSIRPDRYPLLFGKTKLVAFEVP